jgi:hypothetical protein
MPDMKSVLLVALALPLSLVRSETLSASELAATLAENLNSGTAEIRLRMQTQTPAQTMQLRIKQRWASDGADAAYEILFPKERKGETVFIHRSGESPARAVLRTIDGKIKPLGADAALLDSGLAVADAVENFYAWKSQSLAGTEAIGKVDCVVLESKPAGGSIYSKVRSWIDTRRMVPLRVEKFAPDGSLARRIVTTRVVPDSGKSIPGDLRIERDGTRTELDGSRIRRDIPFTDADFSP